MVAEIRAVRTSADMIAVQRQRYEIFIEELKYPDPHADHTARTVVDPQDQTGTILGAFNGPRLIGSVRINYEDFGEYGSLLSVRRFGPYFPNRLTLITKLMIDPAHRAGTLMARFGMELYRHITSTHPQTMFGIMSCVPAHQDFFHRFGYRPIGRPFMHSYAGLTVPMAAALYDLDHFRRVGSSVSKLCPRHDVASSDWFVQTFGTELAGDACTTA